MKLKRLVACLLLCILLLSVAVPCVQASPSDTVYVRKHVSLVYDNSGSMSQELVDEQNQPIPNLKWTYASYAAQIFAGLLNETDSLTLTLMNHKSGTSRMEVDLAGDRQTQVDQLRDLTNFAKGGTPLDSMTDARKVLEKKGLLADSQIGDNVINKSEQYWLVLTTDGQFENGTVTKEMLETKLEEELLKKYSNLQVVYFGIGTKDDNSDQAAHDLRDSAKLKAYPNFTAVYAEEEGEITSTMQALANRISGRYSVTKGVKFEGNEVTLRISGETSPIRNIAILAQRTNATLLSAVDEDGKALTVTRPASEQYPQNPNYDNVDAATKGAHTALITCPDGKFQPGTVKLTFSEPVNEDDFSLMYEPAVFVKLTLQQKDASGNWTEVPYGERVQSGRPLRVGYEICEDGTGEPLDAAKLPGVTTEHITCGDMLLNRDGEFHAPPGNSTITATVSMMDGAYTVSTVRTLQVIALDDYSYEISDPLSFYPEELASNTTQYIEFKILHQGKPADADQVLDFSVDAGDLQGTMTTPKVGVFRFTPKQEGCAPGELMVNLCFKGQPVASQTISVKEMVTSYEATAENDLSLFSNEVAANTQPIIFTVTQLKGKETGPLPEENAGEFRIEAKTADGAQLKGKTTYVGGQLHFITDDSNAQVGEYTVTLYHQDTALASAHISILKYNAQFTAEVFRVGEGTVDLLDLRHNQSALAFVLYADGEACTGTQLEGMVGTMLQLQYNCPKSIMKMDVSLGTYDGKAALIVRPTSTARNGLGAWFQKLGIAPRLLVGILRDGPLSVELTVQAEKGTQCTGTLDMIHSTAEMIVLLIVLLILLLLALAILYVIYCCLHKPRIRPGYVWYFNLQRDSSHYILVSKRQEKIRWRFSLNTAVETLKTNVHIVLRASKNSRKSLLRRPPTDPVAVFEYRGTELDNYFYGTPGPDVVDFLDTLKGTPTGNRLSFSDVEAVLQTPVSSSQATPPAGETAEYTAGLGDGHLIARKSGTVKDRVIELWTFEGSNTNGNHAAGNGR